DGRGPAAGAGRGQDRHRRPGARPPSLAAPGHAVRADQRGPPAGPYRGDRGRDGGVTLAGGRGARPEPTPPGWPPGERASYSNVGYAVLGLVLERVAGCSY